MTETSRFWDDLVSGKFAFRVKESSKGRELTSSIDVYHIMKPLFAEADDVEVLYAIYLDAKNRIILMEKASAGSITSAVLYPREIVKRVIAVKSTAVIVSHNHPSGDPHPSCEDKNLTIKLWIALRNIDVCLHDHIIVGDDYYSFSDEGLLAALEQQYRSFIKHHIITSK